MGAGDRVLGVDVGGVLVDRAMGGEDTSFFGRAPMDTPAVADALESLQALRPSFEKLVIVSRAGSWTSKLTMQWLLLRGFVPQVVDPWEVHFVARREDKAEVCEILGVTDFVDDRLDVLAHLEDVVERRVLFTGGSAADGGARVPAGVMVAASWPAVVALLAHG